MFNIIKKSKKKTELFGVGILMEHLIFHVIKAINLLVTSLGREKIEGKISLPLGKHVNHLFFGVIVGLVDYLQIAIIL
ncbi:MAG: hypothetical protein BAJALOKI1v1_1730005 [Promethearchaeota archaeon]|nr:MAG: hypothetical protein BAJALOKI1v1_1730005 [Candidatus Lokiarchaeota archaeon]